MDRLKFDGLYSNRNYIIKENEKGRTVVFSYDIKTLYYKDIGKDWESITYEPDTIFDYLWGDFFGKTNDFLAVAVDPT
ncbi:hypothetical protein, partial [Caldisericum sp.]|uniref:hypothetical protein n=1 Tax=Caldisericum sp. TaxID=2499687 RepID=UPI003D0AA919